MSLHESSTFTCNVSQPNPPDHIPVENRGVHTYIGFFEAGKYPEALELNRKELKRCLDDGKVAPETIHVRLDEALILAFMDEVDEAVGCIGRTYNDCVRAHDENHKFALRTMVQYARILNCAQRYAEAEVWSEKACRLYEKNFGRTNPLTLSAIFQRAMILDMLTSPGAAEAAEQLYEQASAGREAALGPEHHDTIESMHHQADCLLRHNRLDVAKDVYEKVLSACRTSEENAKERYGAPNRQKVREVEEDAKAKSKNIGSPHKGY